MKPLALAILMGTACVIAGCDRSVTVDVSYAKTDQGIWNSGLSSLSTAFIWDTSANTLTLMDDLAWPAGFDRPDGEGVSFGASDIHSGSISFSGGAPLKEDIVAVDARVARSASLVVTDYRIRRMRSPRQNFVDLINLSTEAQKAAMRLPEAAQPRSPLRYVVIHWTVTGKDAELRFDNSIAAGTTFPIKLASGDIKLDFKNAATAAFKNADLDKGTPAIVQMKVFRVGLGRTAGQTTFQIEDQSATLEPQLLAALRAR